jgi:hypothetical protein
MGSLDREEVRCGGARWPESAEPQIAIAEVLEEWRESFTPGSHRWAVDLTAEAEVAADRTLPARYRETVASRHATGPATASAGDITSWESLWQRATELYERAYSYGMLRNEVVHATRALEYGQVSQLARIVKNWNEDVSESCPPTESEDSVASWSFGSSSSYIFIDVGVGYLQTRRWHAWLEEWSRSVLPTLLAGLDKETVAELIRNVRIEKAAERISSPVIELAQLKSQLARLANAIVPHGPPVAHLCGPGRCPA